MKKITILDPQLSEGSTVFCNHVTGIITYTAPYGWYIQFAKRFADLIDLPSEEIDEIANTIDNQTGQRTHYRTFPVFLEKEQMSQFLNIINTFSNIFRIMP